MGFHGIIIRKPPKTQTLHERAKGVWTRHHCDAEQSQAQGCAAILGRFFLTQQNWGLPSGNLLQFAIEHGH